MQARDWDAARKKLAAAQEKLAKAESVLGHAVAIEKDYARLRELRDVLPAVSTIVTERGRIRRIRAEDRAAHEGARRAGRRPAAETEHALEQARKKLDDLKKTLADDEAQAATLNARLRELAGVLEKVKQVEDAETEVKRLDSELKPLPADPDAAVRQSQAGARTARAPGPARRALGAACTRIAPELTKVAAAEAQFKKEEARLAWRGKKAKEAFAELEAKARAAREDAPRRTRPRPRRGRWPSRPENWPTSSSNSPARRPAGLRSAAHGEALRGGEEETRAGREIRRDEAEDSRRGRGRSPRRRRTSSPTKEAADREHLGKLRDQYKDAAAAVKQAAQDIKRLTDSCRQTYFALPDEFKEKFGANEPTDWTTATYPDRHDIAELSTQARGLDAVKRKLRGAEDEARKVGELLARSSNRPVND